MSEMIPSLTTYFFLGGLFAFVACIFGMWIANFNDELEPPIIFVIPVLAVIAGFLWPLIITIGILAGGCYGLAYLVKKLPGGK